MILYVKRLDIKIILLMLEQLDFTQYDKYVFIEEDFS